MDVNLAEVVTTAQAQGDGVDGLPTTWCGDEITSDYPNTTTKPQFKIVYAYAADRPNRFTGWRDALQANVAIVQRFLSAQSGGTKALRVDMGTRCGPQYVDIQVVALPGARAAFAGQLRRDHQRRAQRDRPLGDASQHDDPGRRPGRRLAGVRPRRVDHGHRPASRPARATSITAAG